MRVLHIMTSDRGGAGKAALRLHDGLLRQGVDSKVVALRASSGFSHVHQLRVHARFKERIRKVILENDKKRHLKHWTRWCGFCDDRSWEWTSLWEYVRKQKPDVVNLHWVAGLIDYRGILPRLAALCPVVWTLHDMGVFTGGCCYDKGCGKYREKCGACPQLQSNIERDYSRNIWLRKNDAFGRVSKDRIRFVADSFWLEREAKSSSLLGRFDLRTIHYGLDTAVYRPLDKNACRRALGIPSDKKVICFSCTSLADKIKGGDILLDALALMPHKENLLLLTMGQRQQAGQSDVIERMDMGFIENEKLQAAIYNCADVFVIPSLQEAFGQTALEAMACGVPVVGGNVGGIPDSLSASPLNVILKNVDAEAIRDALVHVVLDCGVEAFAQNPWNPEKSDFALRQQASSYCDLYDESVARGDL